MGDGSLKGSHLQRWMWEWHQKLQKRLKSEIAEVIKKEERIGEYTVTDRAYMRLTRIRHISRA